MCCAKELGIDANVIRALFTNSMSSKIFVTDDDDMIPLTPKLAGYNVDTWEQVCDLYLNHQIDPMQYHEYLYAAEDIFDQLICKQSKTDLICFKYITSGTRIVSEILDTRSRRTSLACLH